MKISVVSYKLLKLNGVEMNLKSDTHSCKTMEVNYRNINVRAHKVNSYKTKILYIYFIW